MNLESLFDLLLDNCYWPMLGEVSMGSSISSIWVSSFGGGGGVVKPEVVVGNL